MIDRLIDLLVSRCIKVTRIKIRGDSRDRNWESRQQQSTATSASLFCGGTRVRIALSLFADPAIGISLLGNDFYVDLDADLRMQFRSHFVST